MCLSQNLLYSYMQVARFWCSAFGAIAWCILVHDLVVHIIPRVSSAVSHLPTILTAWRMWWLLSLCHLQSIKVYIVLSLEVKLCIVFPFQSTHTYSHPCIKNEKIDHIYVSRRFWKQTFDWCDTSINILAGSVSMAFGLLLWIGCLPWVRRKFYKVESWLTSSMFTALHARKWS